MHPWRSNTRFRPLICCYVSSLLLRSGGDAVRTSGVGRWCYHGWAPRYRANGLTRAALFTARENMSGLPNVLAMQDIEAMTVVQLKTELKARGLKRTGRKAELVRILAEHLENPQQNSRDNPITVDMREGEKDATSSTRERSPTQVQGVAHRVRRSLPRMTEREAKELGVDAGFSRSRGISARQQGRALSPPGGNPHARQEADDSSRTGRPMLPPIDDMDRLKVMEDLRSRQTVKFELEEALPASSQGEKIPESDMYVVHTPQAMRPWEGPHAHRAETHAVLLLTDVFGWEDEYMRCVADQVAEICDTIVLVPDIFRGRPWDEQQPQERYEEWRASHDPETVASDIRASVAYARSEYKFTSMAIMGFCFGGGRALEAAAAGLVKPDAVVAFYPTRYDVEDVAARIECPVAVFFAGDDVLAGATASDARALKDALLRNEKVRDFQVKLCPGASHGFVHRTQEKDRDNAGDAMLLATSWLDLYLSKYLPAPDGQVKKEGFGFWDLRPSGEVVPSSQEGSS